MEALVDVIVIIERLISTLIFALLEIIHSINTLTKTSDEFNQLYIKEKTKWV